MCKGKFSKQLFFILVILLFFSSLTLAKTIKVGPGLGYDYESIQPAIDAADWSDTIIVTQGEYLESINFKGKNLILTSIDPNDWDVVENTIIRGVHNSVVTFSGQENESCILHGITIHRGNAVYGGGINGNGTKATIKMCYINNNDADNFGGGLYDCDGLIDDCIIAGNQTSTYDDNFTPKGGGLYGCDGTIINCHIRNNTSGDTFFISATCPGEGGGLYDCNALIIDCTIENNLAVGNGGGLHSCNNNIENCSIINNRAGYGDIIGRGGGLCCCNGIISGCTIKDNESTNDSGGGLANCMSTIEDCVIQNNTSPLWHAGGAIDCNSFINCTITGNIARGYGGGLYNCNKIDRCTISGNSSEIFPGGGLSDCNSVTNSIISGNKAGGSGAGLYDCNEIINCTIVGNYSQKKAGALYLKNKNGIIDNTIIWDNLALEGGQILVECNEPNTALWNLSVNYSDIQGGQNGIMVADGSILKWEQNNIDTYPMFVQPGSWASQNKWNGGDYHLLHNSPCIDAGDPNRNYTDQNDIDGDARLIGLYADMGADEATEYIPPVFVQLEISGPDQINENGTGQYIAIGLYDDDTQVTLTNEVAWSVEPEGIGTIDSNGLFAVGELDGDIEITIQAAYTHGDQEILYTAQMTVLCVDVPATVSIYYVDTTTGNDLNDGLSKQTAFKTIQKGIDSTQNDDTVLVYPGVYREGLVFWGKNITLKSAKDAAVIENPNNIAVLFCFGETNKCKIQNFVIRNSKIGILNILDSSPTIKNLTFVNNETGIQCFDSDPDISNCIFWFNTEKDFANCMPEYSCTEDTYFITLVNTDLNIHLNPLFVNPENGDYHLKSERGRYWPLFDVWVLDSETSPCIDAGNPNDDFTKERQPNGGRINIGAYGNTPYASLSLSSGEQYKASMPNPQNGAIVTSSNPTLSWTAGVDAVQHDVYFGINLDKVRDATRENPYGVLVSHGQNVISFKNSVGLEQGTQYFWRIDEIDSSGSITKGSIWTFTKSSVRR